MSAIEIRTAVTLALVFFLRMLPLFMVLPVLSMAGSDYKNATPELLGLALGINGLTQACLQIPFGMLSDRYGRKSVITAGLLMFIGGSLLAAMSSSIYGLIAGRALQGAGAISSASMALAADLTRESIRTRVMAMIGISIGIAFPVAFILGPFLFSHVGLNGLFYLSSVLGVCSIIMLLVLVPTPAKTLARNRVYLKDVFKLVRSPALLKIDISIFILHLILMANFVVIPLVLRDHVDIAISSHWLVYLVILITSLGITIPMIMLGEKAKRAGLFFSLAIILISLSQAGLYFFTPTQTSLVLLLVLFFGAFNYMEALLPSEVSRRVEPDKKGTALGIFSASQFIGIFCGGTLGGILYQHSGMESVHLFSLFAGLAWLVLVKLISDKRTTVSKNELEEEAV